MHKTPPLIRWPLILLGATLFFSGLITFWLPIPIGIPLMLIGMPILIRYSPLARLLFTRLARRFRWLRSLVLRCRPKHSR